MKLTTTHLIVGGAVFGVLLLASMFNWLSIRKFQYSFFSKPIWYFSLAAAALLLIGVSNFPSNFHEVSFTLAIGTAALAGGVAIIIGLAYFNCIATSLWFGLAGSLVQIPLLLVTSIIAVPVLFIGGFIWVAGGAGHASPPTQTRHQKQLEWYYNRMNPNGFHKKW